MSQLRQLPNIGLVLEQNLRAVGVNTVEELINLGSRHVFERLRTLDDTACLNTLYALEGAVQGIRWHLLNKTEKEDLKRFFADTVINSKKLL